MKQPPTRRAGNGPYREATLADARRPRRVRPRVMLAGAMLGATGVLAVVAAGSLREKEPVASPQSVARASSLAGGARIMAVLTDREGRRTEVLRVPGAARRRGADVVAEPEALEGHGAAQVERDGEHLVDGRGEFLRVRGGVVRPPMGFEVTPFPVGEHLVPAWAQVVQRAGRFARMSSGALLWFAGDDAASPPVVAFPNSVSDVATDGAAACAIVRGHVTCSTLARLDVVEAPGATGSDGRPTWSDVPALANLYNAERVAVAGRVACVLYNVGRVACSRAGVDALLRADWTSTAALPVREAPTHAVAMALGRDDLCLLDTDHRLLCAHGPQEDAASLGGAELRLRAAMEGVDEVGLTAGLGCARRGGRIDCWGPLARGGWVVRRDRAVPMEGLRDVTALVAHQGTVCALAEGAVSCWGVGPTGDRYPRPVRVAIDGRVTSLSVVAAGVCAEIEGHPRRCWGDVRGSVALPDALSRPDPPESAARSRYPWRPLRSRRGPVTVMGNTDSNGFGFGYECAVLQDGRVACYEDHGGYRTDWDGHEVPDLQLIAQVVVARGGLACARDRTGAVWCWHDNASGALTVAEAERAPRVVTLRR